MDKLNFSISGNGFPVVLLHGFCESNKIWKNLTDALSVEFTILCPDLPGFGKSPAVKNPFTLTQIGNMIMEWLDVTGIKQPVLIGHSLGGYIALEVMRNHQRSLTGIGLFNSSAFQDAQDKKENRDKLIQFLHQHGVEPFIKTFVPSLFYPSTSHKYQDVINEITLEGLTLDAKVVAGYAAAMRDRQDSLDLLHEFSDRILLIAGEEDQNVPIVKSREMAALLNKENTHFIPRSAHMSLFEQPALCYDAIRKFVRSVSR